MARYLASDVAAHDRTARHGQAISPIDLVLDDEDGDRQSTKAARQCVLEGDGLAHVVQTNQAKRGDHQDADTSAEVVERFASGADRSDETASAVFFILHLAGEKQDTRVFSLLCRLAQDVEALEAALGDTATIFKPILISTYDGDLDTLKGLIEAAEADEFVRAGALEVLAYLTATGRIPREETEAYLLRLYDTLQPQQESFVWSGWVLAIGLLGLETLSGVVHQAFARGLIDPMVMGYDHFRRDLERTLADPARMAGFEYDRIGPLEDADWRALRLVRLLGCGQAGSGAAGHPSGMLVWPLPTRLCRLLTRSTMSGATIPARAAAARSSRSAAWAESLSGRHCRACCEESAQHTGAIRSFADPFSLATLTGNCSCRCSMSATWRRSPRPTIPASG